jgi:Rha family phage regulatory protein
MAELMNVTQTLSSMEVAEMVEMEHKYLMRNIRKYSNDMASAEVGAKISPAEFWIESFYLDSQDKQRPCYQITKLGCEFIAHKTTGAKGTAFTAKYIVRFHQMEEALKSGNMIAEGSSLELEDEKKYLAKYNRTWYDKEKWKMDKLCYDYGWDRKYMYHKILKELGDIYNLECLREMFYNRVGREAKYDMDLVNHFPTLQLIATRYLDFLLDA